MNLLKRSEVDQIFSQYGLQFVVFTDIYRRFSDPDVQALFGKVAAMKLSGYRSKHQDGVLPLDGSDFVGTHLLICQKDGTKYGNPLTGFKSISLSRCQKHRLAFPPVSLIRSCEPVSLQLESEVQKLMANAQNTGGDVYYNGSWTLDPSVKKDKVLYSFLFEAVLAMLALYYSTYNFYPLVAAAVVRFGIDKNKEFIGFSDLSKTQEGSPILIRSPHFSNSELRLMVQNVLNEGGREIVALYERHWNARITFGELFDLEEGTIAA